jgi:glycolate oxidase iron-sulfur subunit
MSTLSELPTVDALATRHDGGPDPRLINQCVHCGLCLSYCPTYVVLGLEADSPRGRIYQMKLATEGEIRWDDPHLRKHIFQCLDCRACQTACPSGVQYGKIVEAARAKIPPASPRETLLRRLILDTVFTSPVLLDAVGLATRFYQRSGLQTLAWATGLLPRLAPGLARLEALLPPPQGGIRKTTLPEVVPAHEPRVHRVGLVAGCVMAQLFGETNQATARVLARNGCEVVVPREQRCCGALHMHSGEVEAARELARRNIEAFERAGVDYVVVNAAGCGSTLKEYGHLLADDPEWAERARAFSARVRDVSELLASLSLRGPLGRIEAKVTYSDPCHLAHGQGVREQPRQLLRSIPGVELVELNQADWCCGSAGIYNITQPELSKRILTMKVDNVAASGAEILATGNPGCAIQIAAGCRARGLAIEVVHPIDLLDRAYQAAEA